MPKIIILYWEPGSCGDFIHSLLLSQDEKYQGIVEDYYLTEQGQAKPNGKKYFNNLFVNNPDQWYTKVWTQSDCNVLKEYTSMLNCDWFIIPTHVQDQMLFLQSQFPNSLTMGINYSSNMFPLVFKNFCKKSAVNHRLFQEIYNKPMHKYLRKHGVFGEFIMSEQLAHGVSTKQSVDIVFDVSISLEDIYNNQLSSIQPFLYNLPNVTSLYNNWITKQNSIHQYHYNLPLMLKNSLGYNSKSTRKNDTDIPLDHFDNILIKHHCCTNFSSSSIPKFKTLSQACDFFR